MTKDIVGVVGAGTMGAGIAQVALEAGHEVVLHDVDEDAIQRGRTRIREGLARRAAKLDLDADSIDDWVDGRLAGLRDGHSLDAVGAEAGVVIEAALEDLELKRTVFRALDEASAPDAILATNTSALSIAAVAAATRRPERLLGLHFFNPAPLMRLVEVVSGPSTSPAVARRAAALVASWDRSPVACADSPGFIVNRVNRPFTLEALAALERRDAGVEAIDAAVRAAGYPMGPFELMDLVGIDVNLAAARGVWEGFDQAGRFRPSPIQEQLVNEERLGRKTNRGFYRYEGGAKAGVDLPSPSLDGDADADAGPAGDVATRIELAVIAEAWRALESGIATEADIDLAMRLGAGHRVGPFERTRELGGASSVRAALAATAGGGPRFEVPAILRESST